VKPALPYFPCDKGVQARVVDNNKSPGAPANGSSWNEPERSGHAILLFLAGALKCIPIITNSLPFANSKFTFANNMQIDNHTHFGYWVSLRIHT
jgi:hypothetical protein